MTNGTTKIWPQRHRFTSEEYNLMAEIGLLDGEPHIELIEGEIIHMAPMGTQHCNVVDHLSKALSSALEGRATVIVQRVFRLSNITEAQPDIVVLKRGHDSQAVRFPTGDDTLLVIEVSDTTSLYDRDIKVPLYASHGIPEVWIVDLESRCLHFFRSPVDGQYTDIRVVSEPGATVLAAPEDLIINLSGLLS